MPCFYVVLIWLEFILRFLYKCTVADLREGMAQFFLRVHHDRTAPGDRFADRLAGDQQEPCAIFG